MEFEVYESVALEDGKHEGEISRIEYRSEPYQYTDVYIKEHKHGFELKYGCPSVISDKSRLGKLISQFQELKIKEKIDPEKLLIGKKVTFMTMQETTKEGGFTKIVADSVKNAGKK